jgi:hypothetical protein
MSRSPDSLADWFLGGAGKRRLLYALTHPETWGKDQPPWSKKALARLAGLQEKNAVNRHIEALRLAELIVRERGRYRPNDDSKLRVPLRELTGELDQLVPRRLPRARGGVERR